MPVWPWNGCGRTWKDGTNSSESTFSQQETIHNKNTNPNNPRDMDILKKNIAPITDAAWSEIETQTKRMVKEYRTGRKLADVNGPRGIELGAISTGRLKVPSNQSKEGVRVGIREVVPLVEVRKPFSLDLWELDNASRHADDVDLGPLEKAATQMAAFEDQCLYYGFDNHIAPGLVNAVSQAPQKVKLNVNDFMKTLAGQITGLQKDGVQGPYALVLPDKVWETLVADSTGYPFHTLVTEVTRGTVLTHHTNKDVFLVSERGGDIELHLGQDLALGYDAHDKKKVHLFFTESFTYQIHSPEAVRVLQPN